MEYTNKKSIVMRFYNIENALFRYKCTILAKFVYHLIQILFGCTIPYSAELHGANIAHFHGIVIHHKTKVGEGTVIYQNVTLGGRNGRGGATIGKNCVLGAGACVLGNIRIGNNVKIGANAVILQDVPDGCTVVGVPGKIVKRANMHSIA